MRILTRYILREVTAHALIGAGIFTFVLFTRDLGRILELVVRASAPLPSVAEIFFFTVPLALTYTLPMSVLLGGVRYGAGDTPSGDATADFYEFAVERLAALGMARYEISNFARPGFESRHNLKYWKLEPYIGFGADAHSFDGRTRHQNPESVEDYLSGAGQVPDVAHLSDERFFIGLRLSAGIRPAPEEWRRFEQPIRRHSSG